MTGAARVDEIFIACARVELEAVPLAFKFSNTAHITFISHTPLQIQP